MTLAEIEFNGYEVSISEALDRINAGEMLGRQTHVLIKPNLVNAAPHPVTTPAACCAAVIQYIKAFANPQIVIGEGCGDAAHETGELFQMLGYADLRKRYGVELVDLNHAPLVRLEHPTCRLFPEMYLPEIALSHFLISVPVLKAHSLAVMSGTLKNMIGLAPPKYYSGEYGIWKKSLFHHHLHRRITELNRYRTPDMTVMDASIGLSEYHLGGPACSPPVNTIIAGCNPVEVDRRAASLLKQDWTRIPHLKNP
ncbi:MAG: DUF362 domain-containing protein [Desulfobacterales bacterium]